MRPVGLFIGRCATKLPRYSRDSAVTSRFNHRTSGAADNPPPLRLSVIRWALLAILVLIVSWIVWSWADVEDRSARATASLTTTGGLGGCVYLTVRYRKQELEEKKHDADTQHKDEDDLAATIDALSSDSPLRRLTGARQLIVRADAQLHDDTRQRIIDIICGHLRLQRFATLSDVDQLIELLLLEALTSHFKKDPPPGVTSWKELRLDLRGAHLSQPVDFSDCEFRAASDWRDIRFRCDADFSNTCFKISPSFSGAGFQGRADFSGCRFESDDHINFLQCTFHQEVAFVGASFHGAITFGHNIPNSDEEYRSDETTDMCESDYYGDRVESDTSDADLEPQQVTFGGSADFSSAVFHESARFGDTDTNTPRASRYFSVFEGDATFDGAHFLSSASFQSCGFERGASFKLTSTLARPADEEPTTDAMHNDNRTIFRGSAMFNDIAVSGRMDFDYTVWHDTVNFAGCYVDTEDLSSGAPSRSRVTSAVFSFTDASIRCAKHDCTGDRMWPPGVALKEGDTGDIPIEARCPKCDH
ncbi:pentapeptide repeat-containing protein [Actinomyces ruminicola]|uniref:pentapeptide repeat-containing protein n=1 Tax=Actinomyces ruminicola TaxID=332524 RepID=UPI00115FEC4C|nr:pentapeptide repeat-containing protein [Actinomyces ruminicola]